MLAIQNVVNQRDIPVATTICLFLQHFGPTVAVHVAQSGFLNNILPEMRAINPDLTAKMILEAGATGLRGLVPETLLPNLVVAYADSLRIVYVVAAVLGVLATIVAVPIPWK